MKQAQTHHVDHAAQYLPASTISGAEPQLPAYVKADLHRFSKPRDLREESPNNLAQLVAAVVETESPVHIELVIERIREHYALGRAGQLVREAVQAGISVALRIGLIRRLPALESGGEQDEFFVAKSDRKVEPRGPMQDGTVRKIEHVCDQEIDPVIVMVVSAMVGAKRDEAIMAAARAFGYARTGNHVEDRMSSAVDRLLATGTLKERLGSLVLGG